MMENGQRSLTPTQKEINDLVEILSAAEPPRWDPSWTKRVQALNNEARIAIWTRILRAANEDIERAKLIHKHLHQLIIEALKVNKRLSPLENLTQQIVLSACRQEEWIESWTKEFNTLSDDDKATLWQQLVTSGECDVIIAEKVEKNLANDR